MNFVEWRQSGPMQISNPMNGLVAFVTRSSYHHMKHPWFIAPKRIGIDKNGGNYWTVDLTKGPVSQGEESDYEDAKSAAISAMKKRQGTLFNA